MNLEDRFFEIVAKDSNCQVLIEIDPINVPNDGEVEEEEVDDRDLNPLDKQLLLRGQLDRAMAFISIKVYYTPEARARNSNIFSLINILIRETNDAFALSGICARLFLHCTEQSTVRDNADMRVVFNQFEHSKGQLWNH